MCHIKSYIIRTRGWESSVHSSDLFRHSLAFRLEWVSCVVCCCSVYFRCYYNGCTRVCTCVGVVSVYTYADLSVGACVYYVFVAACDFHSLNASAAHTHTHTCADCDGTHTRIRIRFIHKFMQQQQQQQQTPPPPPTPTLRPLPLALPASASRIIAPTTTKTAALWQQQPQMRSCYCCRCTARNGRQIWNIPMLEIIVFAG